MGLTSNLLHLHDILIPCFHFKSKGASAVVRDAFDENGRLHRHVFGFKLGTVKQRYVG
jgi:hypothetical protein